MLCIPQGSLREALIKEAHSSGLASYFEGHKIYTLLSEKFSRPQLKRNVNNFTRQCFVCPITKGQ